MARITFLAFQLAVRRSAFPEGEAPNVKANHKKFVLDALIDLQLKVPRLQRYHIDYIPQPATYFNCGASVFEPTRGMVRKLSTITCDEPCSRVVYSSASKEQIDCMIADANACEDITHPYQTFYDGTTNFDFPTIPILGFEYPGDNTDLECRATEGWYARYRDFIWIFPALRSDEIVELEWDGIKREWADTDTLEDDAEVAQACELYLIGTAALREDCNMPRAEMYYKDSIREPGLYQVKVGDMIWQAKKEAMLPKAPICFGAHGIRQSAVASASPSSGTAIATEEGDVIIEE